VIFHNIRIVYYRQINVVQFTVTNGHLRKINRTFFTICKNKFDYKYD